MHRYILIKSMWWSNLFEEKQIKSRAKLAVKICESRWASCGGHSTFVDMLGFLWQNGYQNFDEKYVNFHHEFESFSIFFLWQRVACIDISLRYRKRTKPNRRTYLKWPKTCQYVTFSIKAPKTTSHFSTNSNVFQTFFLASQQPMAICKCVIKINCNRTE